MLVGTVVVEPAGPHDRVGQPAGAHQPLGAPLPVVGLGGAVVGAGAIGDSDGSHQCDARFSRTQRPQDVTHTAVVDALGPHLSGTVGAEGKHDGLDTVRHAGKRVGSSDVSDEHLRFGGKPTCLGGGSHQGTHYMALPESFINDEASDATGRTDDQHRHAGNGHETSFQPQLNRVMTSKPTVSKRVMRSSVSFTSPRAIWRVTSRAGRSF